MDEIFFVAIVLVLLLFLGAILGAVSFFKVRRLECELRDSKIKISRLLTDKEWTAGKQEPSHVKNDELNPDLHSAQIKEEVVTEKPSADKSHDVWTDGVTTYEAEWAHTQKANEDFQTSPVLTDTANPLRNLEETIGSLWAVWVGGLALALGAVFLVKFSIEKGLLSPGVRIFLGLLFSAVLIALGEWSRRRGRVFSFPGFAKADIPAILTAAGTMGAFASVYAAYELYDMLSQQVALVALGVVAIATAFAALLHGPLLGALGILASFVAPVLISTGNPSALGLGIYILSVSVSGFTVGRLRLSKRLSVLTASGLMLYGFVLHDIARYGDQTERLAVAIYVVIAWCMIAYVFVTSLYKKSDRQLAEMDRIATGLLALMLTLVLGGTLLYQLDVVSVILLMATVAGPFMLAFYYSPSRAIVYVALVISAIAYLGWSVDIGVLTEWVDADLDKLSTYFQIREKVSMFTWVGVILAALGAAIGLWGVKKSTSRAALAIGGAFLPLLLFCANYVRLEGFAPLWPYPLIASVLFVGYLSIANYIFHQLSNETEGRDAASAAYAVAAFAALALLASLVLEKAALTIALALMVPAIAFVYHRQPLPALRPLAALAALLWIGRVFWQPAIIEGDLGSSPVFNWLTYGYGIPTAGFAFATWLIGKTTRDRWLEVLEAITLASFVATLGLVGLHAIDPTQVFTPIDTLEEVALITIIGGGVALALLLADRTKTSYVLKHGLTLLGGLGMVSAAGGLLIAFNPWQTGDDFGSGLIFNGLLFSYVFPGILYLTLGWRARTKRHRFYVNTAFALGALLLATWINLTIRHVYHPTALNLGSTNDSELYTYSVVWLLIGIALLTAGILIRIKQLRMVSVGILVLVVGKVFLIDMAGLEGILRALSFIGLGATLIGIGLVYQQVLSKPGSQN